MIASDVLLELPIYALDVRESDAAPRVGHSNCVIHRNIKFSTDALESFCSTNWQPAVFDALVLAAAVEFCDRAQARPAYRWGRRFELRVPVHEPERWSERKTHDSLVLALNLLTGDDWDIRFIARKQAEQPPHQPRMEFPTDALATIAFSEGMDSRAVAGLESIRLGARLVRVRVGTKRFDGAKSERASQPFTSVPYEVVLSGDNAENSARSRGFKFSLISAIAAYLVDAPTVIVPESGQGALAPALIPVGQAYPDYRNHPAFTERMEAFVKALLGHDLRYEFPRLWHTKSETLREYVDSGVEGSALWSASWSCWQQSRQVSVEGHKRQCGVCAACVLRRLSVHAAGLNEPQSNYVWENLKAEKFEDGAHSSFDRSRITRALREYAIGGFLHFDHLAALPSSLEYPLLRRRAGSELARSLREPYERIAEKLDQLLAKHKSEWTAFTESLGEQSFAKAWIDGRR